MTEPGDTPRDPAPDPSGREVPFGDFEIESETMPDGRQIHYYRWPERDATPAADPAGADV